MASACGGCCQLLGRLTLILIVSGVGPATSGWSQDAAALVRQANTELRTSQRHMFSGKFEQAAEELKKAAASIEQLEATDPNHAQVKSLKQKYDRQKKDLDKRMGKSGSSTPSRSEPAKAGGGRGPHRRHSV